MSRRWRWGGIALGSGFYIDVAPTALGMVPSLLRYLRLLL